jgi:iron(II)-dependent oxidoreductase
MGVRKDSGELVQTLQEARARTLGLVADLSEEQMIGPKLAIVNPLRWEIGHVAWFQERWALRHLRGRNPILEGGDALYDSANVAHDIRWDLWLPSREKTLEYMQVVLDRVIEQLNGREPTREEAYFYWLAIFHEDMHGEAMTYTRQTLGYPPPKLGFPQSNGKLGGEAEPVAGDAEIPGGNFLLGATRDLPFVFDNEKWAHSIALKPFRIARAAVTNENFLAFVEDGGYGRRSVWSEAGWRWREQAGALHPLYWQREAAGRWRQRVFESFVPLRPSFPVIHVNWFEAQAYCNWAGRRLPSEAEWELAASVEAGSDGRIGDLKRIFPWGREAPTLARANLDARSGGCADVGAFSEGDSAFGCRQMIGNVWEWTGDVFLPYPGFVIDPYKEYSQPWFGDHKVLRGGCWTTRSRLIRNTWRNFYTPDRRDVWAGFRTCAK